jgi:hypothetical protein
MVQTCKKGLRKICLIRNKEDWDLALPYIAMGYRMSKYASLSHFSPHFLLFGRHPIPPSSIIAQMDQVMDLNSLATWVKVIEERVLYLGGLCPWPSRTCPLHNIECHNPSLGLATKARVCKGAGQEGSPWVTSHAPGSVRKCEGMNLHMPKWVPILGVGVPMDSRIFKKWLQGSKHVGLISSLYHWKSLRT